MASLSVNLFGPPRFESNGEPVKFPTAKALALAAYACYSPNKYSRETLAAMFWPELPSGKAHSTLRTTIWRLKDNLGDFIDARRTTLEIPARPGLWIDARHFTSLVELCRGESHSTGGYARLEYPFSHSRERISCSNCLPLLDEAVSICRGEFMQGFTLRDSPDFDHWLRTTGEFLLQGLTDCLERLVAAYAGQNRIDDAIQNAQRWLALTPTNEEALRQLMWLTHLAGNRAAAIHLYQEYEATQVKVEGIEPEEETILLYRELQSKTTPLVYKSGPASRRAATTPPQLNVPALLTPFVGRKLEIEFIYNLLSDPACRLLTLIGIGGAGKTRLALQAAIQLAEEASLKHLFADGVCFVPLASIHEAGQLTGAIAAAMQYSFFGKDSQLAQLAGYLKQKHFLIILDNLEHLTESYEILLELLERAPHLKVLATSRRRLNIRGEWVLPVRGLEYPIGSDMVSAESFSAVQLFMDCARRADPFFFLKEEDRDHLIRICSLLDGLPLGIEMAAPWIRSMSLEEIAEEIQHNLDSLISDQQDTPDRQSSLRAIFEYIWDNLAPVEKEVLKKLCLYQGGFSRERAARAAGISARSLSEMADKFIVNRSLPNRYEMMQMYQVYVQEQLAATPAELDKARTDHCQVIADYLDECNAALQGPQQFQALDEISLDMNNIRAAWAWAAKVMRCDLLEKMSHPLARIFTLTGTFTDGAHLFDQALFAVEQNRTCPEQDSLEMARLYAFLLLYQSRFIRRMGQFGDSLEMLHKSRAAAAQLNDPALMGEVELGLGHTAAAMGNYEEARSAYQQALEWMQTANDPLGLANVYTSQGNVCEDRLQALDYYRDALQIYRQLGNSWATASCMINLAEANMYLGNYFEARQLSLDTLRIFERLNSKHTIAAAYESAAEASIRLQDYVVALEYLGKALEYFLENGNSTDVCRVEVILSSTELRAGRRETGWPRVLRALNSIRVNPNRPLALDTITTICEYLVESDPELCAVHLACVDKHPAAWGRTKQVARQLLDVVKSNLPGNVFASAVERGESLDPLDAAGSLIEKFAA